MPKTLPNLQVLKDKAGNNLDFPCRLQIQWKYQNQHILSVFPQQSVPLYRRHHYRHMSQSHSCGKISGSQKTLIANMEQKRKYFFLRQTCGSHLKYIKSRYATK